MEFVRTLARAAVRDRSFRGRRRVVNAINRIAGNDKTVWANLANGRMRLDLRVPLENAALWQGSMDLLPIRRLTEAIGEGAVVLDVGANIGLFSVPLGIAARGASGQLVSFEPMPVSAARLRENLAANGVAAIVMELALGDQDGTLTLVPVEPGATANAHVVDPATPGALEVRVRRLDDVADELRLGRCDIVKIDIEGGELAMLRGGVGFLGQHRPLMYAELHRPRMTVMGWSDDDLFDLIEPWSYDVFVETPSGFEPFRKVGARDNILLVPR